MTVVMYRSQQQGRRGQRIDTRLAERQSSKARS